MWSYWRSLECPQTCAAQSHTFWCVFFLFWSCRFTETREKTTTGQENKSGRNVAFVVLLTQMKSHSGMCMCVSVRKREGLLYLWELCVSVLREWVKLLHSTLGLLPNACHPVGPLPLACFLPRAQGRKRGTTQEKGQKDMGKGLLP